MIESGSMENPDIILASSSPRRQNLLAWTGWSFRIRPVEIDETPHPGEPPGSFALRLAESKAHAASSPMKEDEVILACDTIVADGSKLLGKPTNIDEAKAMLRRLRGHTHQVYTAIAVSIPGEDLTLTDLCVSQVPMREYGDEEIEVYTASGDPLDKAGAYAIQHPDFNPVAGLRDCYASVMGLPLCHLVRILRRLDITPRADVPRTCQDRLQYQCPVSHKILKHHPLESSQPVGIPDGYQHIYEQGNHEE